MLDGPLIIVHIFPFECEIRMDNQIKFQIQCINAALVSPERQLEIDVITQKFMALVIPK